MSTSADSQGKPGILWRGLSAILGGLSGLFLWISRRLSDAQQGLEKWGRK